MSVWSVGNRLARTNEKAFDKIDEALTLVRERVLNAQRHIAESRITTEDVEQSLRNWSRQATNKRLESRLEVEKKSERLSLVLRQASQWLELSDASIQGIQQTLKLAKALGAPVDTTLFDSLLEYLARLRSQLGQATESVDGIRERAADAAEGATQEDRIEQAVQLALRVVVTFREIDAHLRKFADKLSETRIKGQDLQSKIHVYILAAKFTAVVLIAWMAAGQACMCLHGWRNYQHHRSAA